MKIRRYRKILREVFHIMGADKIIVSYFIFFFIMAFIIWIVEPNIKTFMDSIWFCFATATTTGYGDITAISLIGRILAIILSVLFYCYSCNIYSGNYKLFYGTSEN